MLKTNRRELLKRAAAAGVAPLFLPMMKRVRAEAVGAINAMPKRFLFVVKSSGLTPAELVPKGLVAKLTKPGSEKGWPAELKPAESLLDVSLGDHELPDSLQPLSPFKNELTLLQGLSGKMCRGGHSAWYGALGCYHTGSEGNPGRAASATVDGRLAKSLPAIFPHVGLTLGGKVLSGVKDSVVYPGISAIDTDRPLPYQASPQMAYKNLFGIAAEGAGDQAEQQLKSMLLDHMVSDIQQVQAQIAGADREKLDHYLEAFESLRDRRRQLSGLEATIRRHAPLVDDKYESNVETDRIEAHFDIATATLIAGLSNVVTIRADTLDITYRGLGIQKHVHGLGHAETVPGMTAIEARNRIRRFQVEQIARVAAKLKAVPEGDGTMLDNTLIVYLSDSAEKHHGSCVEWPFVLLGGLTGKFKKSAGGRYLQYPAYGNPGHRTIACLYNSLLYAVEQPHELFGRFDLNLDQDQQRGPLAELLV
jgi:hypothetical protein